MLFAWQSDPHVSTKRPGDVLLQVFIRGQPRNTADQFANQVAEG